MNIIIDFEKGAGLVPVIVQDADTKEVLMQAYADKEALELTLKEGYAYYYSRSRKSLWKKGETSGHLQKIEDMLPKVLLAVGKLFPATWGYELMTSDTFSLQMFWPMCGILLAAIVVCGVLLKRIQTR